MGSACRADRMPPTVEQASALLRRRRRPLSGALRRAHRDQRRTDHRSDRRTCLISVHRHRHPPATGMYALGRQVHAAIPPTRAAAGVAPRALFRLDASDREAPPDDRGDAAQQTDRPASSQTTRSIVALAVPLLRDVHPRRHWHDQTRWLRPALSPRHLGAPALRAASSHPFRPPSRPPPLPAQTQSA